MICPTTPFYKWINQGPERGCDHCISHNKARLDCSDKRFHVSALKNKSQVWREWKFPGGSVIRVPKLPLQGTWVQSLVGELRFSMPCSMAKLKKGGGGRGYFCLCYMTEISQPGTQAVRGLLPCGHSLSSQWGEHNAKCTLGILLSIFLQHQKWHAGSRALTRD